MTKMKSNIIDMINRGLGQYDASLNDSGAIVTGDKALDVFFETKGRRLRAVGSDGALIASGAINQHFVESFVERFWFWEKQ